MTTADALEVVARSFVESEPWERRRWLEARLAALGAEPDAVVAAAAGGMESDDRNDRVKALRLLALYPGADATAGVLRGLGDPARRVRKVAMDSACPHHIGSALIVAALHAIIDDEGETTLLRQHAFSALSGGVLQADMDRDALLALMGSERFRLRVLLRLCRLTEQTTDSRAVLHEFVRTGSKEEAVMATRALSGYVAVRLGDWLSPDEHERVVATYDPAPGIRQGLAGGVMTPVSACWIPVAEAVELARAAGYSVVP
jgi:hypothetical protein